MCGGLLPCQGVEMQINWQWWQHLMLYDSNVGSTDAFWFQWWQHPMPCNPCPSSLNCSIAMHCIPFSSNMMPGRPLGMHPAGIFQTHKAFQSRQLFSLFMTFLWPKARRRAFFLMYNSDSDGGGLPTVVMVVVFHMHGGGDGGSPPYVRWWWWCSPFYVQWQWWCSSICTSDCVTDRRGAARVTLVIHTGRAPHPHSFKVTHD